MRDASFQPLGDSLYLGGVAEHINEDVGGMLAIAVLEAVAAGLRILYCLQCEGEKFLAGFREGDVVTVAKYFR